MRRFIRDNGDDEAIERVCEELLRCKRRVLNAESIDSVRGIEGEAATAYFGVFSRLLLNQKEDLYLKVAIVVHQKMRLMRCYLSYILLYVMI